jgi:8-oxo-dGTP diphosphatase
VDKHPTLVVVALVEAYQPQSSEPMYAMTRRREDVHLAGMWEFPGGKVNEGESPDTAIARELHEELGVKLESIHPTVFSYHTYETRTVLILFYKARIATDSPPPQALDSAELRLMPLSEVLELEMPAANDVFCDYLRQCVD